MNWGFDGHTFALGASGCLRIGRLAGLSLKVSFLSVDRIVVLIL